MVPYPRLSFFDVDTTKFSDMLSELLQKGKIEMSHPDPSYDPDNSYEDDMNYDDYNDFHDENAWNEFDSWDEDYDENEEDDVWDNDVNDSMDGDFDSAMRDCGFGTDEDYGYYGEDY